MEFYLEDGITDEEAQNLLDMAPPRDDKRNRDSQWREDRMGRILARASNKLMYNSKCFLLWVFVAHVSKGLCRVKNSKQIFKKLDNNNNYIPSMALKSSGARARKQNKIINQMPSQSNTRDRSYSPFKRFNIMQHQFDTGYVNNNMQNKQVW